MNIYGYMILSSSEKARNAPLSENKPAESKKRARASAVRNALPRVFVAAISLAGIAWLVLKPDLCIPAAKKGLLLWAGTVLPALLPFFFLTSLLSSAGVAEFLSRGADKPMNVLFRQSGVSFFVFLTSVLSGYPVGAKLTAELCRKGILSRSEGTRTACLCSTSGPLFVIGSVGTALFGNRKIGVAIYAAHLLAALCCGLVFRFYGDPPERKNAPDRAKRSANALYDAAYSSVLSVLLVGGFVCLFYLLADALHASGVLRPAEGLFSLLFRDRGAGEAFAGGLIECTRGCAALAALPLSPLTVSLAAAIVSSGGVSVIAQSLLFLNDSCCDRKLFLLSKGLQTALSFPICYAIVSLFSVA